MDVKKVFHKNEWRIAVIFDYEDKLIERIRTIRGRKWSATLKCWHLPYTKDSLNELREILGIEKKKRVFEKAVNVQREGKNLEEETPRGEFNFKMDKFITFLNNRRYSPKTIQSYRKHVEIFLDFNKGILPEDITIDNIYTYNQKMIIEKGLSESYQNQSINAVKSFFKTVYNKKFVIEDIKRPKHSKKLPCVLSQEDVEKIIKSLTNLKHKTIFSLIYSGGLRISEVVNIELSDMNYDRMIIKIRGAKGKKDRIVGFSKKLAVLIDKYKEEYKPSKYLFEGGDDREQYTTRSIQAVFDRAKKKTLIDSRATVHTLRHSYATHLLEAGVDLRIIQELLGHKSSKTTEIYTHVSKRTIENVVSPLDKIDV